MRRSRIWAMLLVVVGCCLSLTPTAARALDPAPSSCSVFRQGTGTSAGADVPVGNAPCPGVRPGGLVDAGIGTCTLNFVFRGSDKRVYIGTAGHCAVAYGAERSWAAGSGPRARIAEPVELGVEGGLGITPVGETAADVAMKKYRFGEVAYAALSPEDASYLDFALIRLDQGTSYSPALCYWGGPTGGVYTYTDRSGSAGVGSRLTLRMYGHGMGISGVAPARTWIGWIPTREGTAYASGPGAFGDSGSPVILDDGRAVGVMVATNIGGDIVGPPALASDVIVRLGPAVARAEQVMRIKLTLLAAPLT